MLKSYAPKRLQVFQSFTQPEGFYVSQCLNSNLIHQNQTGVPKPEIVSKELVNKIMYIQHPFLVSHRQSRVPGVLFSCVMVEILTNSVSA